MVDIVRVPGIDRNKLSEAMDHMADIARSKEGNDRTAVMAAKVLLKGTEINQKDEHHHAGETVLHTHTGSIDLRSVIDEARRDGAYIQLERQRLASHGAHTGANGHNGNGRQVEAGPAPGTD